MSLFGLGWYEQQELDKHEELTSTTECNGRGLNRKPRDLATSILQLSYPAMIESQKRVGTKLQDKNVRAASQ